MCKKSDHYHHRSLLTVIADFVVRPIGKKGMFSQFGDRDKGTEAQRGIGLNSPSRKGPNSEEEISYSSVVSSYCELFSPFSPFSHFSPDSPDPIYQTTSSLPSSELVYYYHHDHLGNIRAVTDQNKNVVERHDFYPFGEEITTPQSKDQYLFTGKPRDSETGLDYFGARYYSPSLCRFLSVDPAPGYIADTRTLNPYLYAADNPLVYIDRDGEAVVIVAVGIGMGVAGLINGTAEALSEYIANPNASFGDLSKAFGAGFVGGMAGVAASAIVGLVTKNPLITVPIGQGVQSLVTQSINAGTVNWEIFEGAIEDAIISGIPAGKIVKTLGPRVPGRPIRELKLRKFSNLKELKFMQKPGTGLYMRKIGFESLLTSLPYKGELHWAMRDWNRFLWHLRVWQAMKKPPRPTVTVEWEYNWDKMLSYGRANPVPPSQRR